MPHQALEQIKAVARRDDTVIFVGSGLSRWSGLPTWQGLIEGLRDELVRLGRDSELVDRELAGGDLLLAASYAMDKLSPQERCRCLRAAVGNPSVSPSAAHQALVALGPTCFATTNYDTLLERALSEHRAGEFFDVVTPANSLEIPSIIQARADHFVFKPHGDIGNCETIVLTREDYREMLGSRRNVFEAMKTMLASRPVIFVGFGLRDPDFILMRDLLFTTFQSNPADHLAIMPDVHDDEKDYWRRQYGIDLISYPTDPDAPGDQVHAALLDLLAEIGSEPAGEFTPPRTDLVWLTLARYGRGLASATEEGTTDFPLTISTARAGRRGDENWRLVRSLHGDAVPALKAFRGHVLVEGPPGAGKSHVLRSLARELGAELESACLEGELPEADHARVPVLAFMRDYRGDLEDLLERALPVDVSTKTLFERRTAVILLDGLNEAPVSPDEENDLLDQINSLLQDAGDCTVIITTRFASQLSGAEIPAVTLDAVGEEALDQALEAAGLDPDRINPAARDLLRRPLFYRSWASGQIKLDQANTIHDIYSQIVAQLEMTVAERFGQQVSMVETLGRVAFTMIDSGELSAPLSQVVASVRAALPAEIESDEFYQFLVSAGVIVATPLRRLAFYHHSVTEYLAASHLARQIADDPAIILDCLGRRDWDQTLMLAMGFLEAAQASQVHAEIMRVDAGMGLRSLHYVETDQAAWIDRSLRSLPSGLGWPENWAIERAIKELPLSATHIPALEALADDPESLGGVAAAMLVCIDPSRYEWALGRVLSGEFGYNYCARFAETVLVTIGAGDGVRALDLLAEKDVSREDSLSLLDGEEVGALVPMRHCVGELIAGVPTPELLARAASSESSLVRMTIAETLRDRRDQAVFDYFFSEILLDRRYAIIDLNFLVAYGKPLDVGLPLPSQHVIDHLVSALPDPRFGRWAVDVLRNFTRRQSEIVEMIDPGRGVRLQHALLLFARGEDEAFHEELRRLVAAGVEWAEEPVHCLSGVKGLPVDVVVSLLRTRYDALVEEVVDSLNFYDADELDAELDDPIWWMDWLEEIAHIDYWSAERLGGFLGRFTSAGTRGRLLALFNGSPEYRAVMAEFVLPRFPELTQADLNDQAVDWLFTRIGRQSGVLDRSVLERVATERMVQERLIPMLMARPSEEIRSGILHSLRKIGDAHGKRYVGDDGEVLP